ncbi:MAG: S8 family serine peptidase [Muribaculaceae bacterium]|nr:S8 family serine peptidase [Muribaculaceae bacterium]
MKNRLLQIILFAVVACSCTLMSSAHNKLTPNAQLSLLQKLTARYDSNGKKLQAPGANLSIMLVVDVDSQDAAGTFAQIRKTGATVLSKLGHQAVISIPADNVDDLVAIEGVKNVDATSKELLKTDVSLVETGVSLIDGTVPGLEEVYTGKGVTICLVDMGFDFQHPAFKDADGNTRLRCVYLPGNDSGHKFIVEDDEAGTIAYPGSVFDTPELIATLTTDTDMDSHGTHTAGIAAGTRSPLGFGGMAPDADIVLVSTEAEENVNEIAFQFVAHYAQQIDAPVVLSASMNSHHGPHNGTGMMPELIDELSHHVIPVLSVGNEGNKHLHIYKAFDEENSSIKAFLARATPIIGEDDNTKKMMGSVVCGYSRNTLGEDDTLSVQIGLLRLSSGEAVWQTEPLTISPSQDGYIEIFSDDDEILSQFMQGGFVGISGRVVDGKIELLAAVQGVRIKRLPFFISLSSSSHIEMDLWETIDEFEPINMEGYTLGDSEFSCGDWTSTPNVISVGNYVANTTSRLYTGSVIDESDLYTLDDISYKSSYGVSLNGVAQPTVAAPGNNVVSSISHYTCDKEIAESMQWQGYPYNGMSGTSMSCPTVSGIIALWLQADPALTLDDIKEVLAATSRNDEFTAASPIKWGYGKIDAAAGIEYIKRTTAVNSIKSEEPAVDSNLWFDITGRTYNSKPIAPGIYINSGKKYIIK